MSSESFQERRIIYQKLRIKDLIGQNAELIQQLHMANTEVERLNFENERFELDQVALTVKPQEPSNTTSKGE